MSDNITELINQQLRRHNEMNTLTRHPHAALIIERARQDANGETAAGWWEWEFQGLAWPEYKPLLSAYPAWDSGRKYRYTMTDKHPQYVPPKPKPKLKLIDMSKLPRGTMVCISLISTDKYYVHGHNSGYTQLIDYIDGGSTHQKTSRTHIVEQKDFTYWGGGECPVPDGVLVEVVTRGTQTLMFTAPTVQVWAHNAQTVSLYEIIGYRIIGVAPGWTDNPEQAA